MQGGKTMNGCRTYLRKLSQPLGTQRIQYPRRQISSIKPEKKKKKSGKEVRVYAREISQGKLLTSWGKLRIHGLIEKLRVLSPSSRAWGFGAQEPSLQKPW
jgi:hypothetical protein